ncbi:DUF3306 domain-containing protein [uncultured Jannaschia sp.]|uniref:DUF3306 domain-containing protein n=1 Tax=uncultured Jannaschia sp. TaxID=293347 RepID=UPI0026102C07|nr:DUF3306 domain-containing protein [uncultured Jannaschia sp.]
MSDFWSRRRQAVEAEDRATREAETKAADAEVLRVEQAELADLPDAEVLARLDLPDPDGVVSGDDISAFLRRVVPGHIRNRALRALWRSNPVLANLDGLNDYDGDFTGDGLGGAPLRTSYEVGRGLAAHVRKLAAAQPDRNDQENVPQDQTEIGLAEDLSDVELRAPEDEAQDHVPAPVEPPRRMRFTFEEDRET